MKLVLDSIYWIMNLSYLLKAGRDQGAVLATQIYPISMYEGLICDGLSNVELAILHTILTGKDSELLDFESNINAYYWEDGGTSVFCLPDDFLEAISTSAESEWQSALDVWLNHPELKYWDFRRKQEHRTELNTLRLISKTVVSTNQTVFLWMCP